MRHLWRDWYVFTIDMAIAGAFSSDPTEEKMARAFISNALGSPPKNGARMNPFASANLLPQQRSKRCRRARTTWFSSIQLSFVLAAGGRPDKTALGDHSPAGYAQRARFYSITAELGSTLPGPLPRYIVFLAATTGLVDANRCATAAARLDPLPVAGRDARRAFDATRPRAFSISL